MKYSELHTKLSNCIQADIPAIMWGPPGVGKSALAAQLASETGRTLYDLRLTSMEPPDLTGLPQFDGRGGCTFTRPDFLPPESDENALLFLDELMAARRDMQPIAYQIIYDRRVGTHKLPKGCRVLAASNRATDHAISERVSTALASRLAHFEIEADAQLTAKYLLERGYDPRVAAFLNWRPSLIHTWKPDTKETAFGCPRTWEMVAKMLPFDDTMDTHAGIVGSGQAAQLMAFLRLGSKLISPQEAIAHPSRVPVYTEPDQAYAMVCAVGSIANASNANRVFDYLLRYKSAEYVVLGADIAFAMCPAESRTAFTASDGWKRYAADLRVQQAMGMK